MTKGQYASGAYRGHWITVIKTGLAWHRFPYTTTIQGRRFEHISLDAETAQHGWDLAQQFLRGGLSKRED